MTNPDAATAGDGGNSTTLGAGATARQRARWQYVWAAIGFCALAIGGFWPTYWGPVTAGSLVAGAPVLHIHGLLFTAWPLFFLTQAWLAAQGRFRQHRALGVAGGVLALTMVITGVWVTGYSINAQSALGYPEQARIFSIASFSKLVFFAVCVAIALAYVRRPGIHKRMMVLATVALMQTALARIFFVLFAPDGSPQRPGLGEPPSLLVSVPTSVVTDLILVAIALYDWRAHGRLHPAYLAEPRWSPSKCCASRSAPGPNGEQSLTCLPLLAASPIANRNGRSRRDQSRRRSVQSTIVARGIGCAIE
jgi:hypothetical protein